jgi:hypothetical protein
MTKTLHMVQVDLLVDANDERDAIRIVKQFMMGNSPKKLQLNYRILDAEKFNDENDKELPSSKIGNLRDLRIAQTTSNEEEQK